MAYNVLIQKAVAAKNIDADNRSVISTTDMDNGDVFVLNAYSETAGEGEVWATSATAEDSQIGEIWMAYSPEVSITVDGMGNRYVGLNKDPRAFTNVANKPFDAFKLHEGDIVEFTGDGYIAMAASTYFNVGTTSKFVPASTPSTTGAYLVKRKTGVLHINTGKIGDSTIPTYIFEVKAPKEAGI